MILQFVTIVVSYFIAKNFFENKKTPESVKHIDAIGAYNIQEGLSLSADEVGYLEDLANRLGRPLTDSEVFGFSQVNKKLQLEVLVTCMVLEYISTNTITGKTVM